ncbi:MAG: hydroxymethylpyrimidine/phosphomethylpyrimidine kinase, partial [Myxococcota bacterium]|nr:hydroxymethylpyrimidine/phosphomethylpyrimidine kinase [Myxococcota bacterium]
PISAIKIGMLATGDIVDTVADRLATLPRQLPVVIDPALVSSSGQPLLEDGGLTHLRERLMPMATVVTPNLSEVAALLGLSTPPCPAEAAAALVDQLDGACAVLVTGGHSGDPSRCTDVLQLTDGRTFRFEAPRVDTTTTHGTGCVLSAALTASLAWGHSLSDAVRGAKSWVTASLRLARPMGRGRGPVDTAWRPLANGESA